MCERFLTPEDLIFGNVYVLQAKVVRNTLVIRHRLRSTFFLVAVSAIIRSKMLCFKMNNVVVKVQIGISSEIWDKSVASLLTIGYCLKYSVYPTHPPSRQLVCSLEQLYDLESSRIDWSFHKIGKLHQTRVVG